MKNRSHDEVIVLYEKDNLINVKDKRLYSMDLIHSLRHCVQVLSQHELFSVWFWERIPAHLF